jgi:Zn-dependent peptidase ImmA (M78 family)
MLPRLYIPEGVTSLEEVERAMVELAMRQANSNQTQAAKLLDISRDALRYKLKKFGLMHGEEEEGPRNLHPIPTPADRNLRTNQRAAPSACSTPNILPSGSSQ